MEKNASLRFTNVSNVERLDVISLVVVNGIFKLWSVKSVVLAVLVGNRFIKERSYFMDNDPRKIEEITRRIQEISRQMENRQSNIKRIESDKESRIRDFDRQLETEKREIDQLKRQIDDLKRQL